MRVNFGSSGGVHMNSEGAILRSLGFHDYDYSMDFGFTASSHLHVDSMLNYYTYIPVNVGNQYFVTASKPLSQIAYLFRSQQDLSQNWELVDSISISDWNNVYENAFYSRNLGWILGSKADSNRIQHLYRFENCGSMSTVTLSGLPSTLCTDDVPLQLTGGNPSGGIFSGTGVSGTQLTPQIAGIGSHLVTYTYTDTLGCTNSAAHTIQVEVCTGLRHSNNRNRIIFYPNPADDLLYLLLEKEKFSKAEIIDINGKVACKTYQPIFLIENLLSGLYVCKVQMKDGSVHFEKIIIE